MGGGESRPVSKEEEKEESGPRPEDVVFEKIVTSIPQILEGVNHKKKTFVKFCRDTWIPQRETTLDALGDATDKLKIQKEIDNFCHRLKLISFYFKVLVLILSYLVLLVSSLEHLSSYSAGLLVTLLVITFGDDFLRFYHETESEKVREKIRSLSPVHENDRNTTEKAKILWNGFDSKFMELKEEIDDFVKNVKYNFMDVETKTPGLKRFFQRIRSVTAKDKDDTRKFFDAFLELIHNFNSAKSIYDNVRKGSKEDTSYANFVDRCKTTGSQISSFLEDLTFCYYKMEITDVSKMALDIAVSKVSEVPNKVQKMRQVLDKDRENIKKNTSGVNVKN